MTAQLVTCTRAAGPVAHVLCTCWYCLYVRICSTYNYIFVLMHCSFTYIERSKGIVKPIFVLTEFILGQTSIPPKNHYEESLIALAKYYYICMSM